MNKIILCVAIATLSFGCAPKSQLDTLDVSMKELKDKNVSALVTLIGYPEKEDSIMGKKRYTWSNKTVMPLSSPTSTVGNIGTTQFSSFSVGGTGGFVPMQCEMSVIVDDGSTIKEMEVRGSRHACEYFAERLSPLVAKK